MRQLQKFEALFIANTSTPKKRASALIATRIADVLQLLDSGYSERTIALALADDLDVPSDFVLRVLRKFRSQKNPRPAPVASVIEAKETAPVPATKKATKPTKRVAKRATIRAHSTESG